MELRPLRPTAVLVSALLLLSACGSSDPVDDAAPPLQSTTPGPTTTAPSTTDPDRPDETSDGAIDETDEGTADQTAEPAGTDPLLSQQWGLEATNVPTAWSATGGEGSVIAIIDSGVDLDHPDLVGRLVPGWDFVDGDDQPDDPNGHGTHVAGIAAASANDLGVAGAAPNASIMPVRVLDADGGGSDEVIAEAILWAAEQGADVINLSLGEAGFISRFTKGSALNVAIRAVTADGVIVVAASGNEGAAGQQYRIGVDLLVVNATGPDGLLTAFSNVGDVRAISAPGADILSTAPIEPTTIWPSGTNGYAPLDGTSMAAPLVSGIAALALSAGIPAADVVDVLMSTAANPTSDPTLGAGIVDAAAALGLTEVVSPANPTEAPDDPAATPQPDGAIAGQLQDLLTSLDGTLDATCTTVRRSLDVEAALPPNEAEVSLTGELIVAGFTGAGSYPTTGAVTATLPGQDPIVIPVLGTADVDDMGNGSIEINVESTQIDIAWRCR